MKHSSQVAPFIQSLKDLRHLSSHKSTESLVSEERIGQLKILFKVNLVCTVLCVGWAAYAYYRVPSGEVKAQRLVILVILLAVVALLSAKFAVDFTCMMIDIARMISPRRVVDKVSFLSKRKWLKNAAIGIGSVLEPFVVGAVRSTPINPFHAWLFLAYNPSFTFIVFGGASCLLCIVFSVIALLERKRLLSDL